MVSATPRNIPQDNTHQQHRWTNNGFCNTKKNSTKQYQHNNTQANQQWFLQHQEKLHKTIPTQQHTGQPTIVSTTLRNTPQNNTRTTKQGNQQWFLQHQETFHKTIPTQQHTGEPTMVSAKPRKTPQNNTHTTTDRRANNGFCNTKKKSTKQYPHNNTQANQQWFPQH